MTPIKINELSRREPRGIISSHCFAPWLLFPADSCSQQLPSLTWAKGNRVVYLGYFFSVREFPSKEPFYFLVEIKVFVSLVLWKSKGKGWG
jgi:hypothetical protein